MRRMWPLLLICLLIASPALAADDLEKQIVAATGKAVDKMIFGPKEEAPVQCEIARKLLPSSAPKYLSAYIEACLGFTEAALGKEPEACRHYQSAIETWRKNPPPATNDEIALKHVTTLEGWKGIVGRSCPSAGPSTVRASEPTMIAVPEGATVATLEGISYVMPGGWALAKFNETGGYAYFNNSTLKYNLRIERKAVDHPGAEGVEAERETLSSGHVLEWHAESNSLAAYVKFDDAVVYINFFSIETRVDQETALDLARQIAESLKVLGSRRCIEDCGPGTITPAS
jgi:hypothetical protein